MHKVIENPRKHRFEIMVDGEPAGYAEYRSAPGVRAFVHTVVEERFRGRGLAAELIARALDATREQGLAVEPYCPYVRSYIAKHPDYFDLVPEDRRTQFGLPSSPARGRAPEQAAALTPQRRLVV